jgi:type I restriction enzyme R subunit
MPAIDLLTSLGWSFKNLYAETFGELGSEGRESESQVILTRRLRAALVALNPGLPADAYAQAIEQLTQDRSKQIAVNANRDFYRLLKDGVKVKVPDEHGGHSTETAARDRLGHAGQQRVLPGLADVGGRRHVQAPLRPAGLRQRPAAGVHRAEEAGRAAEERLRRQPARLPGQSVPQLFHPNAFILLSNGSDTKVGTLTSGWEHFFDWKRVADEDEAGKVSLERALRGLLEPARLLDYIENFTVFEEGKGGLIKKGQEPPVPGREQVHRAAGGAARDRDRRRKRLGVFWHTQGSGKSLSMVFFTQKVLRKVLGKLHLRDRDRPRGAGRPDQQDLQGHRRHRTRGRARHQRRAPEGAAARQRALHLHADPEVPNEPGQPTRCCRTART